MAHLIVIGGGITGVTSAYALARQGHQVTLIEKHRYAGMETSHANGGQLSASNAEVWTHPSTLLKGLKWMFKADAPLLVNPRPSWHKLSWFAEFVASIPKYRSNTVATTRLAIAAREHLFGWAEAEGIDFDLKQQGILHIYRDRAGFEHAGEVSKLLAEGGLPRRAVTPDEMRAIEPTLRGDYFGGYYTESDSTGDIHKFTHGLGQACARLGVKLMTGQTVARVRSSGTTAQVTLDDGQVVNADAVVISAGVHSRALGAQLGDRLNVYPVKGYSITVMLNEEQSQAAAPQVSLLDDETKLVTSRLGVDRFRVVDWVNQCFPGVSTRRVEPWAGLRPMMPNMMPRVGAGRQGNVFYNTGHGHLGWTLSAITAHQLGEHVAQWERQRAPRPVPVAAIA
jgi:D-amino-acid dehydrogenase